jgi:hypothetical protein
MLSLQVLLLTGGLLLASPPNITLENNPLKGSVEAMRYQNATLDKLGFPRIKTEADIRDLYLAGKLVRVPSTGKGYYLGPKVRAETRFLYPHAFSYLKCRAEEYRGRFHKSLKITTLARTGAMQTRLKRLRISSADANASEMQSGHLAGVAFDISLKGMTQKEIAFLTERFVYDSADGKTLVFLELWSRNFHVTVFKE